MIRTQVYLPEDLYQEVTVVAKNEKKATAALVRELLRDGLILKRQKRSIGKALLSLANIKARGPEDLSAKIDKYLYQE